MDVGGLARGRQPLRIGHRREVAVVGVADPARARQIGAIFGCAAAAQHRLARRRDDVRIEALSSGEKHSRSNCGSLSAVAQKPCWATRPVASTKVMRSEAAMVHRMPNWHSASAFDCGRNSRSTQLRHAGRPPRSALKVGIDVETGTSAGAGRPARGQRRVGGRTRRPRATGRRRRAASAPRAACRSSAAGRAPARRGKSSTDPVTPVRLDSARSVGVSTITSATSPEKLMSLAPIDSSTRSSLRSGWRFGRHGRGTRLASCALTVPRQVFGRLVGRHSRARCGPISPSGIVAPLQASGR